MTTHPFGRDNGDISPRSRPESVDIREVGPRDGLQAEEPIPVEKRVDLIQRLFDIGLRHIEACSFVSPKAVPSMAGAADVIAALRPPDDARIVALVPNLRGAQLAAEAGVPELSVTISASAEYNRHNVRMEIDESVAAITSVVALGMPVDAVVSCAFGSPYEGDVEPAEVAALGRRLLDVGCASLTFADTTGMATPRRVLDLLAVVGTDVGVHFHDTRGTALVNAYAAYQAGVRRFDSSIGGLGGSPFAPGAAGNLATEELVHMLADLGVETGVDPHDAWFLVAKLERDFIGHRPASRLLRAGTRDMKTAG